MTSRCRLLKALLGPWPLVVTAAVASTAIAVPTSDLPSKASPPSMSDTAHHPSNPMSDEYQRTGGTLYLNIIWHQHQPLYLDPATDQLQGPWVRTHATKDYYDMTAALERYPNIHFTVNLTSSLLHQLTEYYVERLKPYVDLKKNTVRSAAYLSAMRGKTDPWIDIALTPTERLSKKEVGFLFTNVWNAFGVSDVILERFPAYHALREKFRKVGVDGMTVQDRREVKFWFYAANLDPDFLDGKVRLATRRVVDVTDIFRRDTEGRYHARRPIVEEDCLRMVAETYKICAAIVPLHRKLMYHPSNHRGQLEVLTTPYYHPILPLIYDSDLARICQPNDRMPERYHFPKDADAQVAKAVEAFKETFGIAPFGMWPGEGSVAQDVLSVFARRGISWIATDEKILYRSKPGNQPVYYPYAAETEAGRPPMVMVFRETELSDKIGFVYKEWRGEDAADDFVKSVLKYVPPDGEADRLLTVILDGENAWEWYRYDNDGKDFQNALYRKLSKLFETKQVITTTVTEYIKGNPLRGIPAHPVEELPKLEWLWPGSWINANYDTWIGEDEENRAWDYLLTARKDLEASGVAQPDPSAAPPRKNSKAWYAYRAWESMYAAEGSDWFWWYGTDQNAPAGDRPFDMGFVTHLQNIYTFAAKASGKMPKREFRPIIAATSNSEAQPGQGTMAQSTKDLVKVVFRCNVGSMYARTFIAVAGNHPSLGDWKPNTILLRDDGTQGDEKADDGVWTREVYLPRGFRLEYKYTNSGPVGAWTPGEEFASNNRVVQVEPSEGGVLVLNDTFGVR
ncbi:MAG: hypothetical protein MUE68_00165 [Bacteroidetes bacterium]|jgi:alpha-amylase/alpha-mannosidase (GH57 family)|nr:hypothetical protein [Bacteroidota bacterium]